MSDPSDRTDFDDAPAPGEAADDDAVDETIDETIETHERPAVGATADPEYDPTVPDGELPAVLVDGPSESHRHPAADRCPYCLTFIGLNAARRRGVRFCPLCGADWQTIGRTIDAPSGAVIPFGEGELPLGDDEDDYDHPTAEYTRRTEPVPAVPAPPAPAAEPAPPASAPSPWLMLATGLVLGLAGTLGVAFYLRRPPEPVTPVAPPVVAHPVTPPDAPPAPPVETPPTEAPPTEAPPIDDPLDEPPEVAVDEPAVPPPVSSEEVQAALLDTAALLPPSELVDITARVEGDVVFLDGRVGSNETLGQVVAAVAAVPGVRAVDSRGVKPAARLHTVTGGDTLAKLARLYYSDPNAWPRIYDANRALIDRPDRLVPGMKLRIPRTER
ncbi:MAG: LysM peptidoglycan-binding domain-containing protein [Myxococcales bacterium]|nr:LysM peptidoglycan-binding domain-containing protein [Myxococcales bacterium]